MKARTCIRFAIAASAVSLVLWQGASDVQAQNGPAPTFTICHATGSAKKPFTAITVSAHAFVGSTEFKNHIVKHGDAFLGEDEHCGTCGNACGEAEDCVEGQCVDECVPVPGSCEGICGSDDPQSDGCEGACFCDAACLGFGDCCPDHDEICGACTPTPPSCAGHCGEEDPLSDGCGDGCFCDPLCTTFEDCCSDFVQQCVPN